MMKFVILSLVLPLILMACSGTNLRVNNNRGGIPIRPLLNAQIGKDYKKIDSQYRLSDDIPPRKLYYMGELIYKEKYKNGNTIYIHKKEEIGKAVKFLLFSGDRAVTYDIVAFLVGKRNRIIDWGYGQFLSTKKCLGIVLDAGKNRISSDECISENQNKTILKSLSALKTSTGKSLNSWKK